MVYSHVAASHDAMWDPNDKAILSQYYAWTGNCTNYTLVGAPGAGKCIVLLGAHFIHRDATVEVQLNFEDGAGGGPEMLTMLSGDDQVPDHWSGVIRFGANNALAISSSGAGAGENSAVTINYKIMPS